MTSWRKSWSASAASRLCCLLLLAGLLSCAQSPHSIYLKGDTMGTFYTVELVGFHSLSIEDLTRSIEHALDAFEQEMSNWRPDSWISRFNAAAPHQAHPIPPDALEVVALCLELAERSQGALDPTLAPFIELWGFGTDRRETLPSESEIEAAHARTGYQKLTLSRQTRTLSKSLADIHLNCSAVAKGAAVDNIAQLLQSKGIGNFLINIGGELRAQGLNADHAAWTVGITGSEKAIPLANTAIGTSGHRQRAYVIDGVRYSHIIDPATGYPVPPSNIASASVLAPSCALADGLATLALILDPEQFASLIGQYEGVEVIYTHWTEDRN